MPNQALVIDNGSGIIKAGMAGEDKPRISFTSAVGRPKHTGSKVLLSAKVENIEHFIGKKMHEHRGILKLSYAMDHGVVTNWKDMERLWEYVYSNEDLKLDPKEHPLLLTEAPLNPRANRYRAAEFLFEGLNVPELFVAPQAVLSLYASGRTTGIVCDSGDGVTHVVPVYEGYALSNAVSRSNIAGRDITERLQLLLRRSGCNLLTSAEKETVRTIKEQLCYVAFDPAVEEDSSRRGVQYVLPDGQEITITKEAFRAPEVLFRPDILGSEELGLHECVHRSIMLADRDLRSTLYKSVVLAGGSTMFRGFGDRLLKEIRTLAPQGVKITINAPPQRLYSTWVGGSILAALPSFSSLCVSKSAFLEEGPHLLDRLGL